MLAVVNITINLIPVKTTSGKKINNVAGDPRVMISLFIPNNF